MDLAQAYEMALTSGVVLERPGRGLLRLTGPQRVWFLQNTISNDVESVATGRWVESCFLELKGKVLAHFRVGVGEDELWLDVDPPGTADLLDWFVRYRFRTKVEIEDRSTSCFTVLGAPAEQLAPDGTFAIADGAPVFGGRIGDIACTDVRSASLDAGFPLADEDLYEILRIEAGIGRFGADYGLDTLPQEAGLTHIVSVEKGCYVGQEVMARLHFRGHVNRTLRPLTLDGIVPAGTPLHRDGAQVGKVTSCIRSPARGPVGIGMVRVEVAEAEVLRAGDGIKAVAGAIPPGTKLR